MKFELVAFDLDGVLLDTISTWVWVHDHFGVNNDASLIAYLAGEIDDMEFMRRDIALWHRKKKDMHISDIERILADVPLMYGAEETMEFLKENLVKTAIVSGGIDIAANRVAERLGIDYVRANGLKTTHEGYLTGDGVLNVELCAKGKPLLCLLEELGVDRERCASVGNSAIDIPMFEVCRLGIAFNPSDDDVTNKADVVVHERDLRKILPYLQDGTNGD